MSNKSFLRFDGVATTKKTATYMVVRVDHPVIPLGVIRWWSHWRRYCFFPTAEMLFDAGCLREITEFIDGLMKARREDRHSDPAKSDPSK